MTSYALSQRAKTAFGLGNLAEAGGCTGALFIASKRRSDKMDKPRPIEAYPEHASVMPPDHGEPEKIFHWYKLKPDAKTGRTVTPLWGVLGPHGCAVILYADGVFTVTGLWSGTVTKDSAWLRALDKEFSQLLFDGRARCDMDRRVSKDIFQSWVCKNA